MAIGKAGQKAAAGRTAGAPSVADAARAMVGLLLGGNGPTVAEVKRAEGPITVPPDISYADAAAMLTAKAEAEEEIISVHYDFPDAFPWEGALAFQAALDKKYGGFGAQAKTHKVTGMFGMTFKIKPKNIHVNVDVNKTQPVSWGRYTLPNDGWVETRGVPHPEQRKRLSFALTGEIQRKWQAELDGLVDDTRRELAENSIYRGKAIRVKFPEVDPNDGPFTPSPDMQPTFVDLAPYADDHNGVYSEEIEAEIKQYVYGPAANPTAPKTGVLLAGLPGVGKTLAMSIAARKATQAGKTVIYVDSKDFEAGLRFAATRAPSLLMCEDIDRILGGQPLTAQGTAQRTAAMDAIYNAIDGPDTKHVNVSILLTTNDLSVIPDPFLRPGRVNVTLQIEPPDAKAAQRLLRLYGGEALEEVSEVALAEVGRALAGQVPAVLMGTIQRAKDSAIYGRNSATVTESDLKIAQRSMLKQVALLKARHSKAMPDSDLVAAARVIANAMHPTKSGNGKTAEEIVKEAQSGVTLGV